jgi:hypothetical protein
MFHERDSRRRCQCSIEAASICRRKVLQPVKVTSHSEHNLSAVRACIFDMDGRLINTEDLYFAAMDNILAKYSKPTIPWSLRAEIDGRAIRRGRL